MRRDGARSPNGHQSSQAWWLPGHGPDGDVRRAAGARTLLLTGPAGAGRAAAAGERPQRGPADPPEQGARVGPPVAPESEPASARTASEPAPPRVAGLTKEPLGPALGGTADPIAQAKQAIADCRDRYAQVRDYTCTFVKRERIDGRLTPQHIMIMKARTEPAQPLLQVPAAEPGPRGDLRPGPQQRPDRRPRRRDRQVPRRDDAPRPARVDGDGGQPPPGHRSGHRQPDRDGRQALGRRADPGRVAASRSTTTSGWATGVAR